MKIATPQSLPEGESSSAGMRVSTTATMKADSGAVSVTNCSGCGVGAGDAAAVGCCACAAPLGARPAATAVLAPSRKLRRAIGLFSSALSSGVVFSVMANLPCLPRRSLMSDAADGRMRGSRHAAILVLFGTRVMRFSAAREGPRMPFHRPSPFQAILQVSAVDVRDCQKFVRLETCAADQRAVDLGNTHQFLGI